MSSISRSLLAVLVVSLAVPAVSAQVKEDLTFARSISVTGEGEAHGKPDLAEVNAGVQTSADTVISASQQNQAVLERIMQALEQQDIDEKDVQTANYSIWAEQDYRGPRESDKPRITGYRVSNIVHVRVRDIANIGDVLAAVTDAGANSINGIHFSVEDADALEAEARKAAMADARARAESLASLAGVELGEVLAISMARAPGFPQPYAARTMEMADASAPVPSISPGQQSVTVNIDVTFAIR